ncbi:MAG TPA: rhomboid family intramembrane serine protease [Terriglobales bacterium]|nr:rhomboid family intramembrane serine protease [Terriglobales bacterium]
MANCIACGRQLPAFSFGARIDVCPECRRTAVDVPNSWSSTTNPAPPPQIRATSRRLPPVTSIIVGMNAAVFLGMVLSGASPVEPTIGQLLKWGANFGPLTLGQPWRLLAANYVHIGIIHIALNMWCLWNLGFLAERIFGGWTYFLTYTVCGIAGSLASMWWHPNIVGAGASGAIFGLAGALIAALYLGKLPIPKEALRGTMKSLLTFAAYNLFFGGVVRGIDNSAHIGGLVAGLVVGAGLAQHLMSPPDVKENWTRGIFLASCIALLFAFMLLKRSVPQ